MTTVKIVEVGNYDVQATPRMIQLNTTDVYATVVAAGYLNSVSNQKIAAGDVVNAY